MKPTTWISEEHTALVSGACAFGASASVLVSAATEQPLVYAFGTTFGTADVDGIRPMHGKANRQRPLGLRGGDG